jgi:arsenical pump membrane protein
VLISLVSKKSVLGSFKQVSWSVLLLVAGLFVIVAALAQTGLTHQLATTLTQAAHQHTRSTALTAGAGIGLICNLMNNLPAGLIAGEVAQTAQLPDLVRKAILIGIDLGPNLSVTGSLATILWLTALRREGIHVSGWDFLKIGIPVMLIPLVTVLLFLLCV